METNIEVKVKRIGSEQNNISLPFYASDGAAGADLYACLEKEMIVQPGERVKVPTGLAFQLPSSQVVAFVFARSGLADKKGLALSNGVGVVDSDYRGEVKVLMVNLSQENVTIQHGERIAQVVFLPVCKAVFREVAALDDTDRGEGGFGSTGI